MPEPVFDQQSETEEVPAMEVHVGEVYVSDRPEGPLNPEHIKTSHARHCIVWLNGKRWEGVLFENTLRDNQHTHN
jgi:hypothetical protein